MRKGRIVNTYTVTNYQTATTVTELNLFDTTQQTALVYSDQTRQRYDVWHNGEIGRTFIGFAFNGKWFPA
jgi:hypothetical protein